MGIEADEYGNAPVFEALEPRLLLSGTIAGQLWNDLNANGVKDFGEPGLPGWTVELTELQSGGVTTTTTGGDGLYLFYTLSGPGEPLPPGEYEVRNPDQPGWGQTYPTGPDFHAVSMFGDNASGLDFGVVQLGSISGVKFHDINGDGVQDQNEPGLFGWEIYLDLDADGQRGQDEPHDTTDSSGSYKLTDLPPGQYTLAEEPQGDWRQSTPAWQWVDGRVSVDSGGLEGQDLSYQSSMSADGRYVAFSSRASDLVAGDTNGSYDVFVRDRLTGQTERVSVDSAEIQGESHSYAPSISADGRYVAFESSADNLAGNDTNGRMKDIFIRDRQSGLTERISDGPSANPSISADGRYVAFESDASSLTPYDTNGFRDIFVYDRQSGLTERVSVDSAGMEVHGQSIDPSISADGRYVAFGSDAPDLTADDYNGAYDIFVHDRQAGQTRIVSADSVGDEGNGESVAPSISTDGRYVAFESDASSLAPGATNGYRDIFVHDRQSGLTQRISIGLAGGSTNGHSAHASISADGRYVAFSSWAPNLVTDDTNGLEDIFVYDRQSGLTERVSVDLAGAQADGFSIAPSISADGRYVAFESNASNLVDGDANNVRDIFVGTPAFGGRPPIAVSKTHGVLLAPGKQLTGVDFGNYHPSAIYGQKFEDINADGVRDPGEGGLEGWTIELVDSTTRRITQTQVTDGEGLYLFEDVAPGDYELREAQQDGWIQTYLQGYERFFVLHGRTIREFDPLSGTELNSFPAQGAWWEVPGGLAFGQGSLFLVRDSGNGLQALWELDPNTGVIIDSDIVTYDEPGSGLRGLAYLDGMLYIESAPSDEILVWDPALDAIVDTLSISENIGGGLSAAPGRGVLFAATFSGLIHVINPSNGDVIETLDPGIGGSYGGLAWFEGDLYRAYGDRVYRIDTSTGKVISTFSAGDGTSVCALGGDGVVGPRVRTVNITSETVLEDIDFGNAQLGSISGVKFEDLNGDGVKDPGEEGLEGWTIFLDENGNGALDGSDATLEPDNYAEGAELNAVIPGVTLTAVGANTTAVYARQDRVFARGAGRVFCHNPGSNWDDSYQLRIDFAAPVYGVAIDYISWFEDGVGQLEAYDAQGNLLEMDWTDSLADGQTQRMAISRTIADIAYAIASGRGEQTGALDNLTFSQWQEPYRVTGPDGGYAFTDLRPGGYTVSEVMRNNWSQTSPAGGERFFALHGQTIREFDPISGTELNSFPSPGLEAPGGLAFKHGSLFMVRDSGNGDQTLWELDPNTGAIIDSDIVADNQLGGHYRGLAYLDGLLYIESTYTNQILVWDPAVDAVADTLSISENINGGLSADPVRGVLFAAASGALIHVIDPQTGNVIDTLESQTGGPPSGGLAWFAGDLYRGVHDTIYRIDAASGDETGSFSVGQGAPVFALGGDGVFSPGVHSVDITSGLAAGNLDFGNQRILPGEIRGVKWEDINGDGLRDPNEPGLEGWTIYIDKNANDLLDQGVYTTLDPDNYAFNEVLNGVVPDVTLTALGSKTTAVYARDDGYYAPDAGRVFTHNPGSNWDDSFRLRMDFAEPVSAVAIDYISWFKDGVGQLEAYDAQGNLLETYVTDTLAIKQTQRMVITRMSADIAYAVANGQGQLTGILDNLAFGDAGEPFAITGADGGYALTNLPPGEYTVAEVMQDGWKQTSPGFSLERGFGQRELLLDGRLSFLAHGDFDGDGEADLAVTGSGSNEVTVLLAREDGAFDKSTFGVQSNPRHLTTGDFDGDGSLDLAVLSSSDDRIVIVLNDGNGIFRPTGSYAGGYSPHSFVSGDLDGDNDTDLAVLNFGDQNDTNDSGVMILLNEGSGSFTPGPSYEFPGNMRQLALDDLDGDGDLDLAANSSGYWTGSEIVNQGAWVLLNNGSAAFAPAVLYETGGSSEGVAIGDLDGDGDADLVLPNRDADQIAVLLNNGDGTFAPRSTYPAGDGPIYVVLGDIDGDGDPDVAGKDKYDQDLWYMLNDSTGSFGQANSVEGPWSSHFGIPALIDSDGLGYSDLVIADDEGLWFMENPEPTWMVTLAAGEILQGIDFGNATIPGPRVIHSSVQEGDQFAGNGSLIVEVGFDRNIHEPNLDETDFELAGSLHGPQDADTWSYDPAARTLMLNYIHLPDDNYSLTLYSETGRFEDPFWREPRRRDSPVAYCALYIGRRRRRRRFRGQLRLRYHLPGRRLRARQAGREPDLRRRRRRIH
ncbi:MAG: SdrD B-like domain-containing protein [Phycisphaerae bacterium]|jgi:Tol biopolymer transport system component|nr:SdrD B-like domain-containing protein [Phycisphaerae bacterium]